MGDFARIIVDAFVMRREHGSAVSSIDQALVLKWERQGVPLGVVLDAVDETFRKRREPPASLSDCARQVQAAFQKWALGESAQPAETNVIPGVSPPLPSPCTSPEPPRSSPELRPVATAVRAAAAQTTNPRGGDLLARLATEVEAHFGAAATLEVVDETSVLRAFGAIGWSSLHEEERVQIDANARRAIPEGASPRYVASLLAELRIAEMSRLLGVGLPLAMR